ncbi:hypothetical protein D1BOALGB6SA_746 [Olavius sp. associated proteobacterium Delta 1]|nr:hypothetical protein D1BOALGB6SA_746 [Olavius sp. associated proteobacterium Delta 1]
MEDWKIGCESETSLFMKNDRIPLNPIFHYSKIPSFPL